MVWICAVCGFSETGDQAPARCPVCGSAGQRFTSSDISENETVAHAGKTATQITAGDGSAETGERWKCPVCGYIRSGKQTDERCPVCGSASERFTSLDGPKEAGKRAQSPAPSEKTTPVAEQKRKWRCTVCGYIHIGPEPPEKCPVCGSDRSVFIEIIEEMKSAGPSVPTDAGPAVGTAQDTRPPVSVWMQRFELLREKMVEMHAHPISVHIPNGLLPIAVLFLLLSMLFNSQTLASASFYNLIIVALAMPAVLFSGYNDWQRRFGGNMTPVFLTKMVCGSIICAGSLVLVIWRIIIPDVAAAGSGGRWGYLLVHLVLLAAAMMAGYQGGKLIIFPDVTVDQ